jgi:Protein of unknown function (DUF4232)
VAGSRLEVPEHLRMRLLAGVVAALIALVLSACGGSSHTSSTTTSAARSSPTSSPTTTAPGSTTAPASTTTVVTSTVTSTTTSDSPPRCVAADLAVSFLGQQGATGHGLLGFALRNTSGRSCHTFGFPGVLFLDKRGHALPTSSTRTTHDFFGTAPEVPIVLGPGSTASFRLGVTHGVTSTAECTTAYGLQVIPPDDTRTLLAKIPGGAYECRTATVSPLRPGNSAYP